MPLFHHDKDEKDAATETAAVAPDRYTASLARYEGLPFPQRAAEVFAQVGPGLADTMQSAGELISALMPAGSRDPDDLSQAEWDASFELEYTLHDAFQALVLARLVMRRESQYKGATDVGYRLSPDGRGALAAGNALEVISRRLVD